VITPPTSRPSSIKPVTDGGGDTYTSLSPADPSVGGYEISAFGDGRARWRIQLTSTLTPLEMATANGRLYISAFNSAWARTGSNFPDYLITLNASDGTVLNQATLQYSGCCTGPIFAYKGGAIAIQGGLVQYFTVNGVARASYSQPPGVSIARAWTANADGKVFAEGATEPCDRTVPLKLFVFDPDSGATTSPVNLPPSSCPFPEPTPLLAPTSDGGVAVANAELTTLLHITADGVLNWQLPLTDYGWGRWPDIKNLHGTSNGHVVFGQTIASSPQCDTLNCFMFQLYDVDPLGNAKAIGQANQVNPPTRIYDEHWNGMAFSGGHIYAELTQQNLQTNTSTPYLYEFNASVGDEYPETSLWATVSPPSPTPSPSPTPTPSPTPNPTPTPSPTAGIPGRYVALGDSYSAGEGTGDYLPGTDSPSLFDTCHRSPHAYGPLVDAKNHLGSLTFAACSGAVTDDMLVANISNPNEPAQLTRLSPATKVVTLTIGGNDGDFPHLLTKCVDGFQFPGPAQDRGSWGCSNLLALQQDVSARLSLLSGQPTNVILVGRPIHALGDLYRQIHAAAPNAQIYVGGYPELFGTDERNYARVSAAPSGRACVVARGPTGLRYSIDYRDALWLNGLADRLDSVTEQQTKAAASAGVPVHFVRPAFTGHGLCDARQSWINPLIITKLKPSVESFHPTAVGQAHGYATQFESAIS
jgi:GDSL-like Lipase/Acylhydrolase family